MTWRLQYTAARLAAMGVPALDADTLLMRRLDELATWQIEPEEWAERLPAYLAARAVLAHLFAHDRGLGCTGRGDARIDSGRGQLVAGHMLVWLDELDDASVEVVELTTRLAEWYRDLIDEQMRATLETRWS